MLIFVTDVGRYLNHETPVLEKYADCVVVVCINGKKVTDKYKCIVSPYIQTEIETDDNSVLSAKYLALESIKMELRDAYSFHENILFLSDNEPQSLYPYLVLKNFDNYNKMHLWCMSPWKTESFKRKKEYFQLLQDLHKLSSLMYVDSNMILKNINKYEEMKEFYLSAENAESQKLKKYCVEWFSSLLPSAIYDIDKNIRWNKKYYYEFNIGRYIQTENSYNAILSEKPFNKQDVNNYIPKQMFSTLGIIAAMPNYPDPDNRVKAEVQQLKPRLDGKKICEELKKMRKRLAEANNIEYKPIECPSSGPCAGTCEQCDIEIKYLRKSLSRITEENRVYPLFEIDNKYLNISPKAVDLN